MKTYIELLQESEENLISIIFDDIKEIQNAINILEKGTIEDTEKTQFEKIKKLKKLNLVAKAIRKITSKFVEVYD